MNTYNTYQEAKIANPDSEIYEFEGYFSSEKGIGSKLCKHSDYLITKASFLASGMKINSGDLVIGVDGEVVKIGEYYDYVIIHPSEANLINPNESMYILRAAALEQPKQEVEQPKHTKVEYVMYHPTPGDKVYLAFENKSIKQNDVLYLFAGRSIDDNGIFQHPASKNIFEESLSLVRRKKIVELTERELVIEQAEEKTGEYGLPILGELYDLGMLKPIQE